MGEDQGAGRMADAPTLAFYDANAADYTTVRPDAPSPELMDFAARLAPGALILELGCGAGQDAAALEARGFRVDACDGSTAMAAIASERLGRAVPVMRFEELEVDRRYDAVVACASLLHVPRAGLTDVLRRIHAALKPGGWHFASFKTADVPGRDRFGRYYNYLDQPLADAAYRAAGDWRSIDYVERDGLGYLSAPARWLRVTAQRAG